MLTVGLRYLNVGSCELQRVREIAIAADEAGLGSLWVSDHVAIPRKQPSDAPRQADATFADPFTCLGYFAGITRQIGLGIGVLVLPLRHPLLVAKCAAGLQNLSNGRLLLGVGCGWLEPEFRALGADFAQRGQVTNEYLRAIRTAWSAEVSSFDGMFVNWRDTSIGSRTASSVAPIVVGGEGRAAVRRAECYADQFFPTGPRRFQLVRALRERRPDIPIVLGVRPDGSDVQLALSMADHVLLPVLSVDAKDPFAVREPEDVIVAADRLLNVNG